MAKSPRTKLAEALLLRADMQTRIDRLKSRIAQSAIIQQGDKPAEDPEKLLREVMGVVGDLEKLVVRINAANVKAKLPDGRSLMETIASRDALKQKHAILTASVAAARRDPDRYGAREIKWVPQVDIARLQKQIEDVAKNIREINALIQEANWKIDLGD